MWESYANVLEIGVDVAQSVSPGMASGKAWADFCSVWFAEDKFNLVAQEDGILWTRKHIYITNMPISNNINPVSATFAPQRKL